MVLTEISLSFPTEANLVITFSSFYFQHMIIYGTEYIF